MKKVRKEINNTLQNVNNVLFIKIEDISTNFLRS